MKTEETELDKTPIRRRRTKADCDFRNHIRIGWVQSTDKLELSVPDRIRFPSQVAWTHLKDTRTLVLSPSPPKDNAPASLCSLARRTNQPDCRSLRSHPVKLDGKHFRMTDTTYEVFGSDLHIHIPPPERRKPPYLRGRFRNPTPDKRHQPPAGANGGPPPYESAPTPYEHRDQFGPYAIPPSAREASGILVNVLIAWTEFGLPEDVVLKVPIEVVKGLATKYGAQK